MVGALLLAAFFFSIAALHAQEPFAQDFLPSVTFSEDYVEVKELDLEDGYYGLASDALSPLIIVIKASTAGMDLGAFTNATPFKIALGDFEFSGVLGDDPLYTPGATSVRIPIKDEDWETGETITVGQAVISWTSGAVTASVQVNRPDTYSVVTAWYAGIDDEPLGEAIPCTFTLGDRSLKRTVFIKGTSIIKIEKYGPNEDDEVELYEVHARGSSDVERPTVKLTSPKSGDIVDSETLSIDVKADDNIGIARVLAKVNDASEFAALTKNGSGTWSLGGIPLKYGDNVIRLHAVDVEGNESLLSEDIVKRWTAVAINVNGDGKVTTGFSGSTLREVGSTISVTATPKPGSVFAGWTGSATAMSPTLTFTVEPGLNFTANFIPSPFIALKGRYDGLVTLAGAGIGSLKVKLTPSGSFTARLAINGENAVLAGSFDSTGSYSGMIGFGGTIYTVDLRVDREAGADSVSGSLTDNANTYLLHGDRNVHSAKNPAPQRGYYTMIIPAAEDPETPEGNGYARVAVAKNGMARGSGALPDGTSFSFGTPLNKAGQLPVFNHLYTGKGFVAGTLAFDSSPIPGGINGALRWRKAPLATADGFYPAGFECDLSVTGGRYDRKADKRVLGLAPGANVAVVRIGEGGVFPELEIEVRIAENGRVAPVADAPEKFALRIAARTGVFTGRFVQPGTNQLRRFRGVILQSEHIGAGLFRGSSSAGYVEITAK